MHHAEFQKLEGSWRGLHYLVHQSETSTMLKIRCSTSRRRTCSTDLERAVEFDQSALFKKVYEEEYGTFGGAPFGALIGDYEFGNAAAGHGAAREDLATSPRRAHAPFIAAAAPDLFEPGELHRSRRAARPGQDLRHRRIRQVEVVPRIRRLPLRRPVPAAHPDAPALRPDTKPVEAFNFEEDVDGTRPQQVPVGQRRLRAGRPAHRAPSRSTAGARRSAAWKAAAWSRACRPTPSRPTRATSR